MHSPCSKKGRRQTHGCNSVSSQPIFNIFSTLDFPVNLHHSVQIPRHLICVATATLPCETSVSENERQSETNAVINDKLQGTVVTYLKCGEIFNNEIKNRLLLSLPVNFF